MKSLFLILLDGLGDKAHPSLHNKTPLQAAHTPNLDKLASLGANGLFQPMQPGLAQPSENAHFAIFGYQPDEFPGRGLLEALGAGIPVDPDEVALLAHFSCLTEEENVLSLHEDRPAASSQEATELAEAVSHFISNDITFRFVPTHGLDGIVLMDGPVSPLITDTDPLAAGLPLMQSLPWQVAAKDETATRSARALNDYLSWCYHTLTAHKANINRIKQDKVPINGLLTQRPGQMKLVEPFFQRWGLRGLSISSGLMYWGLADFLELAISKVSDSKDPGTDLSQRLSLAMDKQSEYDFIHVHTKAPDAAAHSKDPANKVAAIESLDRGIGQVMQDFLKDECTIVITADHSTPSSGPLVHSGEPVPMCVVGPGIRRDLVQQFDEIQCATGCLGPVRGEDFMYQVLNWLDRAKLQGLMDGPINRPYWPGQRKPFRLNPSNI